MRPFSIDEYIKNPSRKVVTRDGRNVTICCTNLGKSQPVVAQIEGAEFSQIYTKDGKSSFWIDSQDDLFFDTKTHEGWVNVYKGGDRDYFTLRSMVYDRKEDAEECRIEETCIATVKIEWEE